MEACIKERRSGVGESGCTQKNLLTVLRGATSKGPSDWNFFCFQPTLFFGRAEFHVATNLPWAFD
jgi:hypothetical protein